MASINNTRADSVIATLFRPEECCESEAVLCLLTTRQLHDAIMESVLKFCSFLLLVRSLKLSNNCIADNLLLQTSSIKDDNQEKVPDNTPMCRFAHILDYYQTKSQKYHFKREGTQMEE